MSDAERWPPSWSPMTFNGLTSPTILAFTSAAFLFASGCDSSGGDDATPPNGTTGASSSGPTSADATSDSAAEGGSGPGNTTGADSGPDDSGPGGDDGFDTWGSSSGGYGSSGSSSGGFGGGPVDCQALASNMPVDRELTANAVFGGSLPDVDVGSDVLVVDFGDAASPSCLGVGDPACAPADELVPWFMFELQLAPSAQDVGDYLIGPGELIYGQIVDTAAQEPTCNSVTIREEFLASFSVYGISVSPDGDLTGLDAYFCDYDGSVWRLDINVCG